MDSKTGGLPDDRTERQRRKDLSDEQVTELERAGGVEGGMQAGSAGGPRGSDVEEPAKLAKEKPSGGDRRAERRSTR